MKKENRQLIVILLAVTIIYQTGMCNDKEVSNIIMPGAVGTVVVSQGTGIDAAAGVGTSLAVRGTRRRGLRRRSRRRSRRRYHYGREEDEENTRYTDDEKEKMHHEN